MYVKTIFSFAMRHSIFIYKNQINFKTLEEVKIPSTNNKNIGSRTLRYMVTSTINNKKFPEHQKIDTNKSFRNQNKLK